VVNTAVRLTVRNPTISKGNRADRVQHNTVGTEPISNDAMEKSMQIPGVNGKNKYQEVLWSGSALSDLSMVGRSVLIQDKPKGGVDL
jgi:hypothetical protein